MEASPVKRFLIDGFPRALDQVEAFECHVCRARTAAFFDCPDDVMLQRALQRGRVDDTPEAMQKRLDLFREASVPVVELLESQGRLLRFDNSRPLDDVAADVIAAFLQIHGVLASPLSTCVSPQANCRTARSEGEHLQRSWGCHWRLWRWTHRRRSRRRRVA